MNLPIEFTNRMREMLQEEYGEFAASYERPRRPGLRSNMRKNGIQRFEESGLFGMEEIPWAPHGYFYDPDVRPGKHPFHEAGVYYMQEPSAMAVAALSGVKPGMRVLDLCAAPGGKSTHLASLLGGEGLLISNEIHPARAKILSQNIERMGIENAIVTNETPERMAARFPVFFDTVVVDAPCSGEGMFCKEPEAIPNWSPENVKLCAERQKGILDCAAQMTAPGGVLVYSTCTFAPQENEQNAALFLMRHPDFTLVDLPAAWGQDFMEKTGLCPGQPQFANDIQVPEEIRNTVKGCIRLWPHKLDGEGHFVAVFTKEGPSYERRMQAPAPIRDKEALKLWQAFVQETLSESGMRRMFHTDGHKAQGTEGLVLFGKELYRMPCGIDLTGLKVLRPGLHLGTLKKNRFEPSHALAMALSEQDVRCSAETEDGEAHAMGDNRLASQYLHGESLAADACSKVKGDKGWCLVTVCGFAMGWGKRTQGQIKNHYPKGLRRPY
jgi:16S rRNA C967 or C1407 C5-methylase (RsmB/RsmF family)/NOL1/NOP2/fmu family ribosome biogenesis protein